MADRRFGGFWRRLLAYAIDKFLLYLLSVILFLIGLLAMGLGGVSLRDIVVTGELPRGMGRFMALYFATACLMNVFYFTWFHGTVGQTLGKRLCDLCVIRTSGEKMTLGIGFLRWIGSLISGTLFCLGFLWIALDHRKQGWHDKIASTLVVRTGVEPGTGVPGTCTAETGSTGNRPEIRETRIPAAKECENASPPAEKCLDKQGDIL